MKRVSLVIGLAAALALPNLASAQTLKTVKDRGTLNCGGNGTLGGFGLPDAQGNWTGLDVDFCRAIAAAVLGDSKKVKFVALTAGNRFTALQSGEVDVLARNTTWTSSRDTSLGLNFTGVNYYDGQGLRTAGHHDRAEPRRLFPRQQDEAEVGDLRDVERGGEGL